MLGALLLTLAVASPASAEDDRLAVLVGTAVTASGSESSLVLPFAHVGARVAAASPYLAPRIYFNVDLVGEQGGALDLRDVSTVRLLELSVGLGQRLSRGLRVFPYAEFGSSTALFGPDAAASRKWAGFGLATERPGGSFKVVVTMDERLGFGGYQPAVAWYGGVKLRGAFGGGVYLVGVGVHGLSNTSGRARNRVTVGVAVGRD